MHDLEARAVQALHARHTPPQQYNSHEELSHMGGGCPVWYSVIVHHTPCSMCIAHSIIGTNSCAG
jgi:hypothetical protein